MTLTLSLFMEALGMIEKIFKRLADMVYSLSNRCDCDWLDSSILAGGLL